MRQGKVLRTRPRIAVTQALEKHGPITDDQGRATAKLAALTGHNTGLTNLLTDMEKEGLIIRHIKGKRCYEIIVGELPEDWPHYQPEYLGIEELAHVESSVPIGSPYVEPEPDVMQLADAVLKRVAEILAMPEKYQSDQERLASVLEDNDRLRNQVKALEIRVQEASDTVTAKQLEANGLRQRVRELEANLEAATQKSNRVVDYEVQKQLAKIMQEKPREKAV